MTQYESLTRKGAAPAQGVPATGLKRSWKRRGGRSVGRKLWAQVERWAWEHRGMKGGMGLTIILRLAGNLKIVSQKEQSWST